MAVRKTTPPKRPRRPRRLAAGLEATLVRSLEVLEEARVPFALIGGLAVACDEAAAEQVVYAFRRAGYAVAAVLEDRRTHALATVRLRAPASAVLVDLLFHFVGIEAEVVEAATGHPVLAGVSAPVAQLEHLLAMKIQANRPVDQGDVSLLLQRADAACRRRALKALQRMMGQGTGDGRDLAAAFRAACRAHDEARRRAARRFRPRRPPR